jgi:hypothetical protein
VGELGQNRGQLRILVDAFLDVGAVYEVQYIRTLSSGMSGVLSGRALCNGGHETLLCKTEGYDERGGHLRRPS